MRHRIDDTGAGKFPREQPIKRDMGPWRGVVSPGVLDRPARRPMPSHSSGPGWLDRCALAVSVAFWLNTHVVVPALCFWVGWRVWFA